MLNMRDDFGRHAGPKQGQAAILSPVKRFLTPFLTYRRRVFPEQGDSIGPFDTVMLGWRDGICAG